MARRATSVGTGCSAHGQPGHVGKMDVQVEVRVIQQAEEEEGGPPCSGDTVVGHGGEHGRRGPRCR